MRRGGPLLSSASVAGEAFGGGTDQVRLEQGRDGFMTHRLGGLVVGVAIALAGVASTDDRDFVSLFDGKTLEGWTPQHTDRFSVRDGLIFNDGGTGWLRSAKVYKDFELHAEYRALKKGA